MSTENNKDFQWNDEAAKAFAKFAKKRSEEFPIELWDNEVLYMFKQHWEKRRTAYEILSFHDLLNRSKVSHNKLQVQYYLERPNSYKIHSVRRMTDGEVFELGDEVEWSYCKGPHKIAEFDFPPERIPFVHGKEPCGFSFPFLEMKKVINLPTPKPLFTTEDGVDIYEETVTLHGINTETWIPGRLHFSRIFQDPEWKWFAIPYNRDRYILMNKPLLSINEVMEAHKDEDRFETFLSAITSLAKAKL
jgi:hypothetical protein